MSFSILIIALQFVNSGQWVWIQSLEIKPIFMQLNHAMLSSKYIAPKTSTSKTELIFKNNRLEKCELAEWTVYNDIFGFWIELLWRTLERAAQYEEEMIAGLGM